jgi:hypothetical protein
MNEWITNDPMIINSIIGQTEDEEEKLPVLVLQVNKLYKLRLLEDPRKIDGTEGYVVKVENQADNKQYLLFLQKFLNSKFKETKAKNGNVLGVVNKGKNMQTGYDYWVSVWNRKLETLLNKSITKKLKKGAKDFFKKEEIYGPEAGGEEGL